MPAMPPLDPHPGRAVPALACVFANRRIRVRTRKDHAANLHHISAFYTVRSPVDNSGTAKPEGEMASTEGLLDGPSLQIGPEISSRHRKAIAALSAGQLLALAELRAIAAQRSKNWGVRCVQGTIRGIA